MGFPLADQTHHGCGYAKKEADSTSRSSQAVPHPSTNQALSCLTAEVRRDLVHLTRYGRQRYFQTRMIANSFGFPSGIIR